MRKLSFCALTLILFTAVTLLAQDCNTIKSGLIFDSTNQPVSLGYDKWGYNYQAHMFNGLYDNFSRPSTPVTTGADNLIMKWSDDWMSNKDCFGVGVGKNAPDGKLDRGGDTTNLSKGWLTNHMEGDYEDGSETCHYTYFAKIVYVGPAPAVGTDPWAAQRIWGTFATIEEVSNDPCAGQHGKNRTSLVNPAGLGFYTN